MQRIRLKSGFRHDQSAEHESNKEAAGVTKKNGCWIEIKEQEAQISSSKNRYGESRSMAAIDRGKGEDGNHGKQSSPGSQPIQAINQVNGIANQHDAANGQGEAHCRAQNVVIEKTVHTCQAEATEVKESASEDLSCQLYFGAQPAQIID